MLLVTPADLTRAAPLVTRLLTGLVEDATPPAQAVAALALVLGRACELFGVDPRAARELFEESYRASTALAAHRTQRLEDADD